MQKQAFQAMVFQRPTRTYFGTQRPPQGPAMPIAGLPESCSFFGGAMSYTGFCTGYNSRDAAKNEVNRGSSHKLPVESYNLCSS